jgi:UDP-glucose 4-epimerase
MRVLVTGSSSCLAQALLPQLCAHPDIDQVTGIDIRPPRLDHRKLTALRLDIRDAKIEKHLPGHDALVHLAFVVLRGRMSESEMFEVNVEGSLRLFRAARAAGIRRLVHLSSAAVYGSGVDLDETAPFDPLPGFLYARHKARLEEELAMEFPDAVRLRPHVILGPHAQPVLKQLLKLPFFVALPEPYPQLQCVHEDDVAQAVLLALFAGAKGPFNLAAEGFFTARDAARRWRRPSLPLPLFAARAALHLAWRISGWGGEPAWIEGLARTLTLDCRRARAELGWLSRYCAAETLDRTLPDAPSGAA